MNLTDRARRRLILGSVSAMLLPGSAWSLLGHASVPGSRRLVLIELSGANDSFNTLVPYAHPQYRAMRPGLALRPEQRIELDAEHALHQSLQPLMPLWEAGELAWVHGLGYPRPDRSHFSSIALWESGGDGHGAGGDGWMTHDIEHLGGGVPRDADGISLIDDLALFASGGGRWLSLARPEPLQAALEALHPTRVFVDGTRGSALEDVRAQYAQLQKTLSGIEGKLAAAPNISRFGADAFSEQLRQLARLILAGVHVPVFRVRLDGFDTHADQGYRHRQLLTRLAQGIARLRTVLDEAGEWQNTILMSYSEFGRRAAENRSGGTDHGTAAAHLLAGGGLRGGLFGQAPDLDSLVDGDVTFTMDYRALYDRVLSDWFGVSDNRFGHYRDSRLKALISTD